MLKRKKGRQRRPKRLDRFSGKGASRKRKAALAKPPAKALHPYTERKPRGRPRKIPLNGVIGHAYNFRIQLGKVWGRLEGSLLAAQTEEEVKVAFEEHAQSYAHDYVPGLISDILALIRDPKFPKKPEARIKFLADSLAGRPELSFRSSRDTCERERAKERQKSPHHIIHKEFYVECSCGYKGPARDNACSRCGAEIPVAIHDLMGHGLF